LTIAALRRFFWSVCLAFDCSRDSGPEGITWVSSGQRVLLVDSVGLEQARNLMAKQTLCLGLNLTLSVFEIE
jgi:hypothetical protein